MKSRNKKRNPKQGHYMINRTLADMHTNGVYFDTDLLHRLREQNNTMQ